MKKNQQKKILGRVYHPLDDTHTFTTS